MLGSSLDLKKLLMTINVPAPLILNIPFFWVLAQLPNIKACLTMRLKGREWLYQVCRRTFCIYSGLYFALRGSKILAGSFSALYLFDFERSQAQYRDLTLS
mgnify:CR=1 FL=1